MKLITGESALALNGLVYMSVNIPRVMTDNKYIDGANTTIYRLIYLGEIDSTNYVSKCNGMLLPTVERAIVDYIRYEKIRDEGTLIWAIQNYITDSRYNMKKVYEVADFYKVPREEIDYWFNEARNDSDYSMG